MNLLFFLVLCIIKKLPKWQERKRVEFTGQKQLSPALFFSSCEHSLITRLKKNKNPHTRLRLVTYVVVSMYLAPAEMNTENVTAHR